MYELTIRTVEAVINASKSEILEIIDGWTIKDTIGMWKGQEESSIEFTTVSDDSEDLDKVLDIINYYAYQLGEESIMYKRDVVNWVFTNNYKVSQ